MNDNEPKSPGRAKVTANGCPPCPICGAKMAPAYRPFCSARCRDVDLHRWLSGGYAIPAWPGDEDDEAERPVPPSDDDG